MSNVLQFRKTPEQKAEAQRLTDDCIARMEASEQQMERFYQRNKFQEDILRELEHCANKLFAVSNNANLAEQRALGAIDRAKRRAAGICGND